MYDLKFGDELDISYPICTDIREFQNSPLRSRRIIIRRLRDLCQEPLTVEEFIRRPFVARSRWLVRSWDVDLKTWRNFYLGSTPEFKSPGTLRLAIFGACPDRPIDYLGRMYHETFQDRRAMLHQICKWNDSLAATIERRMNMPESISDYLPPLPELRIVAEDLRLLA